MDREVVLANLPPRSAECELGETLLQLGIFAVGLRHEYRGQTGHHVIGSGSERLLC